MGNNTLWGTGLCLCGGGGKGAYQAGVIKVLREKGYLDDVTAISGVSIGAINSLLYAMDDTSIMYDAWDHIDMSTVFDFDFNMVTSNRLFFSRDEMLNMITKYIDFDKIKQSRYEIFSTVCRIGDAPKDAAGNVDIKSQQYELLSNAVNGIDKKVKYLKLKDYSVDEIKQILLASTALPVVYEPVCIGDGLYRDGGICDNEPIQPLYDAGIRQFIVIGLHHGKKFNSDKWPDANFIVIYPSYDLGDLISGTLNFTDKAISFRRMLGEKDGLRAINTKFLQDETYIKMENSLAKIDYDEIIMKLNTETKMKQMQSRVDSNIDKFNEIAKKYDIY